MRFISFAAALFCVCAYAGWAEGCSISATPVNFGVYDSFSHRDATGSIGISCEPGLLYAVRIDAGANSGGGFAARKARRGGGSETVSYNLYRDSARTEVWGDGTDNTFIRSGVSAGAAENLTIFGRLPARQNIMSGVYSDILTLTIEW